MRAAVLFLIGVLAGGPAAAIDGVLEINAACVATGCFAGDAAGYPVAITAPGSYALTGNLTVPASGSTIEITASDVTLDFRGHALIGPAVCSGVPTSSCTPSSGATGVLLAAHNVTLENGTIRGIAGNAIDSSLFGIGELVRATRLRNMRVVANAGGAVLHGSCAVEDSTFHRNAGTGLTVGWLDCVIQSSVFTENGIHGLTTSGGAVIESNIASRNGQTGIVGGSASVIVRNTLNENQGFGIQTGSGYAENVISSLAGQYVLCNGCAQLGRNLCGSSTSCPGPGASLSEYSATAVGGAGPTVVATAEHEHCALTRVSFQTAATGTFKQCDLDGSPGSTWTLTAVPGSTSQSGATCEAVCF